MSEPVIPSRRTGAKAHLARAAKSSMNSNEEFYSVQAAIAEALLDIANELRFIKHLLAERQERQ